MPGLPGGVPQLDPALALSLAMSAPVWLEPGERFSLGASWGRYGNDHAIGINGIARVQGGLAITGGVGVSEGASRWGEIGTRVGVRVGW